MLRLLKSLNLANNLLTTVNCPADGRTVILPQPSALKLSNNKLGTVTITQLVTTRLKYLLLGSIEILTLPEVVNKFPNLLGYDLSDIVLKSFAADGCSSVKLPGCKPQLHPGSLTSSRKPSRLNQTCYGMVIISRCSRRYGPYLQYV